jgi:CheY-like chemotaxis protein
MPDAKMAGAGMGRERFNIMASENVRGLRSLVVDDEAIVCDSIRMLLSFHGHKVNTASSGQEALTRFEVSDFDLVITDYAMPGMPGTDLACAVHQRAPHLPVVLVTAYAEMLGSWGADLSHVHHVLAKPFRWDDLRRVVGGIAQITPPQPLDSDADLPGGC